MLKQRVLAVLTGLALLMAVAGSSGVAVDWLGFEVVSPAHACNTGSATGGGC
jgi:hypothetical protein